MSSPGKARLGRWSAWTVLAAFVSALAGGIAAASIAMEVKEARDGFRGDGIGYVIPFALGAAGSGP